MKQLLLAALLHAYLTCHFDLLTHINLLSCWTTLKNRTNILNRVTLLSCRTTLKNRTNILSRVTLLSCRTTLKNRTNILSCVTLLSCWTTLKASLKLFSPILFHIVHTSIITVGGLLILLLRRRPFSLCKRINVNLLTGIWMLGFRTDLQFVRWSTKIYKFANCVIVVMQDRAPVLKLFDEEEELERSDLLYRLKLNEDLEVEKLKVVGTWLTFQEK